MTVIRNVEAKERNEIAAQQAALSLGVGFSFQKVFHG